MKRFFFSALLFAQIGMAMAQVPQSLNYQGQARNASNLVQANKTMKVRLTIKSGAAMGTVRYSETRTITTNANGLFNVVIGSAGALSTTGSFASIDWLNGSHWLMTELDVNNNGTFTDLGTVQMQSTPYAMASGTASSLKLPFSASGNSSADMLSVVNNIGSALSGDGRGMTGVGVKGNTDLNIGVLGTANGSGTAIFGQSTSGTSGRFTSPSTNTKSTVEIEHKGAVNALRVSSAGGQAIQANSTGQGVGVSASTDNNIGVLASSNNTGTAVFASSVRGFAGRFVNPLGNTTHALWAQHQGSGNAIQANAVSGNAISASSTSGAAASLSAPSTGKALVTNGKVQFTGTDMQAGNGKILVSDANGNARWERPVAFKIAGISGSSNELGISQNIPSGTTRKVNFFNTEYNFENGMNSAEARFTAPVQGIYRFNVGLLLTTTALSAAKVKLVRITAGGAEVDLAEFDNGVFSLKLPVNFSAEALLLPGDSVEVRVVNAANTDLQVHNNTNTFNNWFLGQLVTRF